MEIYTSMSSNWIVACTIVHNSAFRDKKSVSQKQRNRKSTLQLWKPYNNITIACKQYRTPWQPRTRWATPANSDQTNQNKIGSDQSDLSRALGLLGQKFNAFTANLTFGFNVFSVNTLARERYPSAGKVDIKATACQLILNWSNF